METTEKNESKVEAGSGKIPLQRLVSWFFKVPVVVVVFVWLMLSFFHPYDDTDNAAAGVRSNMSLTTDHKTGCQYLSRGYFGGLTPRLDRDGSHVGCR